MRKSAVLLGIVSITCALGALWSWRQTLEERARADALQQRLATLESHAAARVPPVPAVAPSHSLPGTTVAEAVQTPATSPAAERPTLSTKSAAPPSATNGNDAVRAWQRRERQMLKDPAYRASKMAEWRARLAQTREDAIRFAGMTEEQADRVIDMQTERNLWFLENGAIAGDHNESPAERAAAMQTATEQQQAEMRALLGDETLAKWQLYLSSQQVRGEVNQLRVRTSGGAAPLEDAQVDSLVTTIYVERERLSEEYEDYVRAAGITDRYVVSPADRQHYLDLNRAANQRIHDAAARTLSQTQLARLDDMLRATLVPIEAALRMQLDGRPSKSN